MATITGTVISVAMSMTAKSQVGKEFPAWELIYRSEDGQIRNVTKHTNGLKYNAALKNGLEDLKAGETFTMVTEKNDAGFLEPKSVCKGVAAAPQPSPDSTVATIYKSAQKPSSAPNNTFEIGNQLKEKAMKMDVEKQPLIIRQVALKASTELAVILKLKTEKDVIAQADRFVSYINGDNKEQDANDPFPDLESDNIDDEEIQ